MTTVDIPVRFGDVDQAKIVYYPRFFHYCHVAMEEAFRVVGGIAYRDVLEKDRLGFPAVHLEADFDETVGYGETLKMNVVVEAIGRTSVTWRFAGVRASDGVPALRARVVTVAVDMDRWKKVDVPPKYRAILERMSAKTA
jgi:4-hydroxybenzoyl-CoA thioesterase